MAHATNTSTLFGWQWSFDLSRSSAKGIRAARRFKSFGIQNGALHSLASRGPRFPFFDAIETALPRAPKSKRRKLGEFPVAEEQVTELVHQGLLCATDAAPNAATRFLEEPRKIHAPKHRKHGRNIGFKRARCRSRRAEIRQKKSTPFGVVSKDCRKYRKLRAYQ
jgi:hypothetical protein